RLAVGRDQSIAGGCKLVGLALCARQLIVEPLATPVELRPTLSELAARSRQVGPSARHANLLSPQRLEAVAARLEILAARIEARFDLLEEHALRGLPLACLVEHPMFVHPLGLESDSPLAKRTNLGFEPRALLVEVADLQSHLLAPLEQALGFG